jgi:hypothetical protein
MSFINDLVIREGSADYTRWFLVEPLVYECSQGTFIVPADFDTDFASVPQIFWSLISPWGRHMKAAVVHDFLYRTHKTSRKQADDIFYFMMKESGVSWWRRQTIYRSVRAFGKHAYNKHQVSV